MIVTFYSYKGGVGRSVALVNVGEILADWGYRVLLCDWDLEAPGLERYLLYNESPLFNDPSGRAAYEDELTGALRNPGLMDLLTEYKTVLTQPPVPPPEDEREHFAGVGKLFLRRPSSYARDVSLRRRAGSLMLLSSGRREGATFQKYAQSVRDFDWAEFYEKWGGNSYIEFFRKDISSEDPSKNLAPFADIVLIDSRTGVTEQGGVCTHHLADVVVLISAANEANIDGTQWMASSLAKTNALAIRGDRRPVQTIPVESRVEITTEKELLFDFHEYFKSKLHDYLPPAIEESDDFFSAARIPYIGFYSFRERIVAREQRKSMELYRAYQLLADGIVRCGVAEEYIEDRVPADIATRRATSRTKRTPRPQGAVYLSYSEHGDLARVIARGLQNLGVEVWADFEPLPYGESPDNSAATLLLLGGNGLTSSLRAELDAALRLLARQAHPIVLVDGTGGSTQPSMPVRVPMLTVPENLSADDRPFFERLAAELATAQPAEIVKESPFRGGRATEADSRFFFGRDKELRDVIALMENQPRGWLHITGDSGSGKTAFVRAALIPAIRRGLVRSLPRQSCIAFCTLGADPMLDVASALFTSEMGGGKPLLAIREQLTGGRDGLRNLIRAGTGPQRPLVLVLDALEAELRREGPSALLDALTFCLADPNAPLYLVTTVRSDAEPLCKSRFDLPAAVYTIEPMKESQLREAIEGPVKVVGARLESGLLDRMIDDCRTAVQPLRLLRRLLDRMWEQGGGLVLTHASYDNAGGLGGILATAADETYKALNDDEKKVARTVLAMLAWRSRFGVPVSYESASIIATIDGAPTAERVLTKLADAGLIAISQSFVELAHPSLAQWYRLSEWVAADANTLRRREELSAAARSWIAAGKPRGGLPYGLQLRYFDGLRPASSEERELLRAAAAHDGARKVRTRVALATVALVIVVLGALVYRDYDLAAKRQKDLLRRQKTAGILRNESARLGASDPTRALVLALEADRIDHTQATELTLRRAIRNVTPHMLLKFDDVLTGVDISADGKHFAVATKKQVTFHDVAQAKTLAVTRNPLNEWHRATVTADGRKVLISSENGPARLWTPLSGTAPAPLTAAGNARAVDVTPDGHYVLMETHGQPSIFDLSENRTMPLSAAGAYLTAGRFSPDGNLVALGDMVGNFFLLNWRNNKRIVGTWLAGKRAAFSDIPEVAFNSGLVAAVSRNGTVGLWDTTTGKEAFRTTDPAGALNLALSSRLVAVGRLDGKVKVYSTHDRSVTITQDRHDGPVHSVAFDPSDGLGASLASGGDDGTVRIAAGNLASDYAASETVLRGHVGWVGLVRYTSDGKYLITVGNNDGTVRVWNVETIDSGKTATWSTNELRAYAESRLPLDLTKPERDAMIATVTGATP